MMVRRLFLIGFSAALAAAYGCSNGSDDNGGGGTTTPTIRCSDGGPAAANGVTLVCGGTTSFTTENVTVVMGGPAAGTTTLRGLNFDVTYDPAKVTFMSAGTTSPSFPTALIAAQLANGTQGRLVVSVQQIGGAADFSVAAGQHAVLTLTFARAAGATFTPTPSTPQAFSLRFPAALAP
jgi:hypothetical protein